jgi:hypothetical protein
MSDFPTAGPGVSSTAKFIDIAWADESHSGGGVAWEIADRSGRECLRGRRSRGHAGGTAVREGEWSRIAAVRL